MDDEKADMLLSWFKGLQSKLEDLRQVQEVQHDISAITVDDFVTRWLKHKVTVPVNFINFAEVYKSLDENYSKAIGDPMKTCVVNNEMRRLLGDLAEPMVDYINTFRLLNVTQALTTFSHYELVDVEVDTEGRMIYAVTEKAKKYDEYETVKRAVEYYNQSV
jgi:hypothetical protein